jgi:Spy/CpxP family protein refolding chaperone
MRASRFLAAGLFVVIAVVVVEAQPPGGGFNFAPPSLFVTVMSNKALQEEIKITDEQKEKLKGLSEKLTAASKKRGESFKEKFADAQGDKDKLKEIFTAMTKDGQKDQEETIKEVEKLLTSEQVKRLKQIDRQRGGVGGFLKEDVAKDLDLTDSQKGKIKSVVEEYRNDVKEIQKSSGGTFKDGKFSFDKEKFEESQNKQKKLTKAAMGDIEDILTDDQRKKWKDLIGEPFDTSKLFQFGPSPKKEKDKEKTKE